MEKKEHPIDRFNNDEDWLKKENANKYESYSKMRGYVSDEVIKDYTLTSMYPLHITKLHEEGYFHIHDLSDGVVPYCKGHDATEILVRGLITPTIVAYPPRHLDSFFNQLVNFLCTAQQEWAGAQAVSDLNTLAAPFVRKLRNYFSQYIKNEISLEEVLYKRVKQHVQSFIYDLNFPSRSGEQTPFTNVTLNIKCPEHLRDQPVFNAGCEGVYSDYEEEARMILEAFNEVLYGGDAAGRPFTFPIITISVVPSTDFSDPLWIELMKTEIKYGSYSIFNYIGTGIKPGSVYATCCRLHNDLSELPPSGGRWAFEGGTGSIGVVTLNMAKLGYLARDEEDFFQRLEKLLGAAKESLLLKCEYIEKYKDKYMPLSTIYGFDQRRFFRTIGVIGIPEMCANYFGSPGKYAETGVPNHIDFVKRVLNYIREWTRKVSVETEFRFNFEMTPGEGCATRLAMKDYEMYGEEIFVQGVYPACYYSNMLIASDIPIMLGERLKVEEQFLHLFTGGTVFRVYIGEANPSPEAMVKLVERIAKTTRVTYFDFAPTFSCCLQCHKRMFGEVPECYSCGGETLIYDRIVGYFRSRDQANIGKLGEIKKRFHYNLKSVG